MKDRLGRRRGLFGFKDVPQVAHPPTNTPWNELRIDEEKNGSIVEQIKNIENEIRLPVCELKSIRNYEQIEHWVLRLQKAVQGTFKNYGSVKLERLYLLHFFRAIKDAEIDTKVCTRKQAEKHLKLVITERLLKHYTQYKKEILNLVKWQLPSEK